MYQPTRGFTLIEIMIALVIMALLFATAWSSYQHHLLQARRADAYIALTTAAAEQERQYLLHHTYVSDIAQLGGPLSPEGFYQLSVQATTNTYTLTARPAPQSVQANDLDCLALTLNHLGVKAPSECW